jgi:branched-chain amino acid transport system substrate-binding protein
MNLQSVRALLELSRSRRHRSLALPMLILFSLLFWSTYEGHATDTIRVAAIFAHSGVAASANLSSILGTRWAATEINQRGGVLGRPIELIEIDNLSTAIGSKVAADKAIHTDSVAIIGPAWSTHALAAARVAQAAGTPVIVTVATHPRITQIGSFIFRVCYNDHLQGRILGRFARQELKAHRAVILQDISSDYSLGLAATFKTTFEQFGGTVSKVLDYKSGQYDFKPLLNAVRTATPDVVFLSGHDESGAIIAEAQRTGLRVPFVGGDGWDTASFFDKGGDQLSIGYYATHWNASIETRQSKQFAAKHKDDYPFLSQAALSYDAVYLLVDAIRRAGSIDKKAIREALAKTIDFQGITGKLKFDANGDAIKDIIIMQITNGQPSYLKRVQPHQHQLYDAVSDGQNGGEE